MKTSFSKVVVLLAASFSNAYITHSFYSFQRAKLSPHKPNIVSSIPSSRLYSTPADDNDDTPLPLVVPEIVLEENPEVQSARETQQSAYTYTAFIYGAVTMDYWNKMGRLTSFGSVVLTSTTGAASLLAAVAAYTLLGATKNSRLNSDTYKRLNLTLIAYSTMMVLSGMSSWKILAPAPGVYVASSTVASHVFAAVSCLGGYLKGARGLAPGSSDSTTETTKNLLVGELATGTKFTFKTVFTSLTSLRTLPYALGAVAASLMVFHDVVLTAVLANKTSLTAMKLMKRSASAGVSSLFFGVLVTLADAAKRDRLSGTTFVYLNAGAAFASLVVGTATYATGALGSKGASTLALAAAVGLRGAKNAFDNMPRE